MKILFLAWKDINHPQSGGAEVVLHELAKRLVGDGHSVTILTAAYADARERDTMDGIDIIRVGANRYLHPFQAMAYYRKNLRHAFDVVVETVNTAPYFYFLARDSAKPYLLYHQLAREIWFHETSAPVSHIGYALLEPVATFILGKTPAKTLTISQSTKNDLVRFGFKPEKIAVISQGISAKPLDDLSKVEKFSPPTLLSLGSFRRMKGTLDQVKAFEVAKRQMPDLQMKIAGDSKGAYGKEVLDYIASSPFKKDIEYLGRTTDEQKVELMQRSHVIGVSSIKEGWGLIVTEAASQGTPAVVYDADGLRDSVKHKETGMITKRNPAALAEGIVMLLKDHKLYNRLQHAAWQWSKDITFDQSYKDFVKHVEIQND